MRVDQKTNNLLLRKQRRRPALRYRGAVFATHIVQSNFKCVAIFFDCVRPGRRPQDPHCWFVSREGLNISFRIKHTGDVYIYVM